MSTIRWNRPDRRVTKRVVHPTRSSYEQPPRMQYLRRRLSSECPVRGQVLVACPSSPIRGPHDDRTQFGALRFSWCCTSGTSPPTAGQDRRLDTFSAPAVAQVTTSTPSPKTTTAPRQSTTTPGPTTTIAPSTVVPPPEPETVYARPPVPTTTQYVPAPTPVYVAEPEPVYVPPAPLVAVPEVPSAVSYANCTAVRAAGAAPIYAGEPGYSSKLDRDGDGVACET